MGGTWRDILRIGHGGKMNNSDSEKEGMLERRKRQGMKKMKKVEL